MNVLLAGLLLFAAAQDPAARERLQKAVDEAKHELTAERERIAKEDAAQEADLAAARATLAKLTDELVDRTGSLSRKSKELEALRADRSKLRQTHAASVQLWGDVRRSAEDARRKLADLVEALPPSESRADQKKRLDDVKSALDRPAGEPVDVRPLLALCTSLLDETRTVAVFVHPVRNADGVQEDARVLRAGMIFHAYQGQQTGRVGEVAAAPSGQAGYRWTESLPPAARADLVKAFDDAAAPGTTLLLPVDVTQRLAPEGREAARTIVDILKAGGPVMIPLLAVGLLALLVVLERVATLASKGGGSERGVEELLTLCRGGRFEEAARLAEGGRGLRMRALSAALRTPGLEPARMEEAVRQAVLRELPALERFLPALAVFAAIAPMLGLLGTVTGMITTFDVIRLFGSGDPGIMAGGISEALVATATGLVIAIPILLLHSWLSGRVDRILADAQVHATSLISLVGEVRRA